MKSSMRSIRLEGRQESTLLSNIGRMGLGWDCQWPACGWRWGWRTAIRDSFNEIGWLNMKFDTDHGLWRNWWDGLRLSSSWDSTLPLTFYLSAHHLLLCLLSPKLPNSDSHTLEPASENPYFNQRVKMEQQNPIQDTPSVFNPPPNHPAQSPSQPQFDPNHHQQNLQHLQQHHQQGSDEPLTEKLGYNTSDYKARFFRSKAKFERANAVSLCSEIYSYTKKLNYEENLFFKQESLYCNL